MPLGLYIAVPFCRTKCSYCNFASNVFSPALFDGYVNRLCEDIARAPQTAQQMGARLPLTVDSVYFGGGSPTVLDVTQLERIFVTISQNFEVASDAEITVECAPGTLTGPLLDLFQRSAVNRVSLGVQSFVDREASAVGRLHKCETVREDIRRLRSAGITNMNLDLIAGLPHQTPESWEVSLAAAIASQAPHMSVYMLEVDEDSRLGRELLAGGKKYHAHFVPDEDLTADLYVAACNRLNAAGLEQYEISNFARPGFASRHNSGYWIRHPYLGFGVDAHSMLQTDTPNGAVRFSAPDSLEAYVASKPPTPLPVSENEALEETFFLGLRLNKGVDLREVSQRFGNSATQAFSDRIRELANAGLLECPGEIIRLTPRGRLLSNEVFARFIAAGEPVM